jgi:hypothetical protein
MRYSVRMAIKAGLFLLVLSLFSCFPSQKNNKPLPEAAPPPGAAPLPDAADQNEVKSTSDDSEFADKLAAVMRNAQLPAALAANIQAAAAQSPAFMNDLRACLEGDRSLRALVDKQHPLPSGYAPPRSGNVDRRRVPRQQGGAAAAQSRRRIAG